MADDPVKKLLIKLGISTAEWKQAVREIKSQLTDVNTQAKRDAAEMKVTQQKQLDLTRQQILDQQKLIAQSKAMSAFDQSRVAWEKKNQEAMKTRLQQKILETAELKKQQIQQQTSIKLEQEKVKLHQQQLKLIQQERQEEERKGHGEGGGLFSKLAGFLGGGFGGKIAGGAAIGTIVGEGAIEILEKGIEKIKELGHELMEAAGPASQLREQFEKLVKRTGETPEEYLDKLRVGVHGLADDQKLFRISNNFMQQGLKLTNDQIVNLLSTTVDLARATGHTAPEALSRLERASSRGRMATLAHVVGLRAQQLALIGVSRSMDPTVRGTMEVIHATEVMTAALKAVGPPATTLPELFIKMHNAQKNWIDDTAFAITRTNAFRNAIELISKTIDKFAVEIGPGFSKFGEFLGPILAGSLTATYDVLRDIIDLTKDVYKDFEALFKLLGKKSGEDDFLHDTVTRLTTIRGWLVTIFDGWLFVKLATKDALHYLEGYAGMLKIMATTNPLKWGAAMAANKAAYEAKGGPDLRKSAAERADFLKTLQGGTAEVKKAGKTDLPTQENANIAKQEAKLRLQLTIDRIKAENILESQRIEQAKNDNKELYESGLEDIKTYLAKERDLLTQSHNLKLKEIDDERKAKLKELTEEAKGMTYKNEKGEAITIPGMAPGVLKLKRQLINAASDLQVNQENLSFEKQGFGPTKEEMSDALSAHREFVAAINKQAKEGVQERLSILEEEFKLGKVNADDYLSTRKNLIDEELAITKTGLDARLEAAKKNAVENAKIQIDLIQAEIDHEKQLTKLALEEDKIRMQAMENHYAQAKKYLEIEIATSKSGKGVTGISRETEQLATATLLDITRKHIRELEQEQAKLNPQVQGFADEWADAAEKIAAARQEEQKLNQQLAISRDMAAPLASIFGSLAGVAGSTGRFGENLAPFLGSLQHSMEQLSKFSVANQTAQLAGQPGVMSQLGTSFLDLFRKTPAKAPEEVKQTAMQIFEGSLKKSEKPLLDLGTQAKGAAVKLKELESRLQQLSAAVSQTVQKLQTPQLPGETVVGEGALAPTITSSLPDVISSTFDTVAKGIHSFGGHGEGTHGGGGGGGISGLLSGFSSGLDNANKKLGGWTGKLGDFSKKLGPAAEGIQGMLSAFTQSKSGAQGAIGGAMGGMQFGMQVGGPIGAAVGAIGGGIMGGIFGAKEKQLQQDLHKIQVQMQGILDSLNAGTITLSQAIADLRRERKAALDMLSHDPKGGKGGGKGGKKGFTPTQAQAAIAEIDSQIQKLVDQQKQVLDNLHQSLMVMSQPQQFQEYISSLDQIIQKYQQFASAASGNAQEVALANQYLTDSLKNYVTTLDQNLNQAQQQAINDAIQLIDLEHQRQQLINSEAQQEYDILTQGVMVRQRTTAMTKGQQIGELRYQRDMQLQQMNEQIALTQHKVDAETKIFGLAKTRIGLEAQLLEAQEAQADYQVQQIQALAQVVSALQSGLSGGQLMSQLSQLFAAGALPTGTGLLQVLLQQLGLAGNVPSGVTTGPYGAANWLAEIPQPYQSAANYVAALDPNFISLIQSGNRRQAAADAKQYVSQGTVEGYDMKGLIQWLGGNVAPTSITGPPHLQEGGKISKTGLAHVHEGEGVLSKKATNVLERFVNIITNPGSALKTNTFMSVPVKGGPAYPYDPTGVTSALKMKTEQHLVSMTQRRSDMEMTIVTARQSLLDGEMAYLGALQDTLSQIHSNGGSPAYSLEGLLQKVYEQRGRYGSGNFRRNIL